jgi:hypothetical protein
MKKYIYTIIAISFLVIGCNSNSEKKDNVNFAKESHVPILNIETNDLSSSIDRIDNCKDSITLRYGTSFGMCTEYCKTDLKITSVGIKHTTSAWNLREDLPKLKPKIRTISFSKKKWKELIDKIDFDQFNKLDDRIGCPDCADGGAEWIEIGLNGRLKTVTIEYGASITELNNLLNPIRELK